MDPKKEAICKNCGTPLVQRKETLECPTCFPRDEHGCFTDEVTPGPLPEWRT